MSGAELDLGPLGHGPRCRPKNQLYPCSFSFSGPAILVAQQSSRVTAQPWSATSAAYLPTLSRAHARLRLAHSRNAAMAQPQGRNPSNSDQRRPNRDRQIAASAWKDVVLVEAFQDPLCPNSCAPSTRSSSLSALPLAGVGRQQRFDYEESPTDGGKA
jgi:hypothetical protein